MDLEPLPRMIILRVIVTIDKIIQNEHGLSGKKAAMEQILNRINDKRFFTEKYTYLQEAIDIRKGNLSAGQYIYLHCEFSTRYSPLMPDSVAIEEATCMYM